MTKKLVIVGGVAGGASAAARARRLSEEAEIVVIERGPHVSFANCGLPYYVGGEIRDEAKLVLQTPASLKQRFNLDVRVRSEAVRIDRGRKSLLVRELDTLREYEERYDDLILATGSAPLKPGIPGIDLPQLFSLRDVPDSVRLRKFLESREVRRAIVVGGGYIGLEIMEQLSRKSVKVTLIEAGPQVMAPLDHEMASLLHEEIRRNEVELILGDAVSSFTERGEEVAVLTNSGRELSAPLVVIGLGVRPEITLAREAGLAIGEAGGIRVNDYLQTSDPSIWAVGDAIEVRDLVTGRYRVIPLAGPANRQGRMAADNIFNERKRVYRGSLGTSVLRLFSLTAAATGASERLLKKEKLSYKALYLHPGSHAGYYPGAAPIAMKILFSPESEKLLGAQAIGKDGVEKRIDVLAAAIKGGLSIDDVADLELCYAPPFGSAKDPVNLAGMMAQNVRDGLVSAAEWDEAGHGSPERILLDVRSDEEYAQGALPNALHIPLPQLRERFHELPRGKTILVYCLSGQRSYYACRILSQHGFDCKNMSGAYKTYRMFESL